MGEQPVQIVRDDTGTVSKELDGQLLILREGADDVVHLDAVATRVWELLAEPHTRDGLAATLAEEFLVDAARVRTDLEPLLALLVAQRLVVPT